MLVLGILTHRLHLLAKASAVCEDSQLRLVYNDRIIDSNTVI